MVRGELGTPLATFWPSLRQICRLALGLFAGVGIVAIVVNLAEGRPLGFILRGLLAAALVFGALIPLLGAAVWPLGVTVYARGLRGRTKWGPKAFIRWSEVAELATDEASGLGFVIIRARGGSPEIWTLPDVLGNPEFQRLVSSYGGHHNPLLVGSAPEAG